MSQNYVNILTQKKMKAEVADIRNLLLELFQEAFDLRIHEIRVVDVGIVARSRNPDTRQAVSCGPFAVELARVACLVVLSA